MTDDTPAPREQQRGKPAPQDRVREAAQATHHLKRIRVVLKRLYNLFEDRAGLNDKEAWDVIEQAHSTWLGSAALPTEHPDLSGLRQALELLGKGPGIEQRNVIRAEIARLEKR